jgi:hypothetical protein
MFFTPLWFYLKGLAVTLTVEGSMFAFIISKRPLKILAAAFFNVTSHILLHLFFHAMVVWGAGYNFYIWLAGEVLVVALEGSLYLFSSLIPTAKKAYFWALVFNVASIIVGQIINLIIL